ncbi:hypothetical protein TRFO_13577 [Tritrichomonas foetus]|uniref:USP domain-containing protein n=1 Tax=Tritrichomonas foetus TaxID=1144522 RepID=A0A1J4L210_9EUKA|nr:hypothetical protein TRFO_13577 [Tritrichomonas foetus]|eukprot:OHT15925.1 hypothetical protein TRFO_13577 [Tritrichomonas foetus]
MDEGSDFYSQSNLLVNTSSLIHPDHHNNEIQMIQLGLRSVGNSCALNSIIQVLVHLTVFKHYIFYLKKSKVSNTPVALALQQLFAHLHMNKGPPPSVNKLISEMGIPIERMAKLNHPIQYLHRIINCFNNDDIFIRNTFIGQIAKENNNAQFLSLSIDIRSSDSLESLLAKNLENKHFDFLPPVLFINLKRSYKGKINHKSLSFSHFLNLTGYLADHHDSIYELFAVIVRCGNGVNGRFYVYIQDMKLQKWLLFDDSKVHEVPQKLAIETNFGSTSKNFSADTLVYIDSSMKELVFEPDDDLIIPNWILDNIYKDDYILNQSENFEKSFKINVVQVEDLDRYATDESNIKFISDLFITTNSLMTVKELYSKMASLLKTKYDRLTIWAIIHSVPCFKITHNYDNQTLNNVIGSLDQVKFFVEDSSVNSDNEKLDSSDYEDRRLNFSNQHPKFIDESDSILVFLYLYDYSDSEPLQFVATVSILFDENIESLFSVARSHFDLPNNLEMIAYQIFGSKCMKIENTQENISGMNLDNGAIIVVQPSPAFYKNSACSRPKKPKSTHGIFTYYPDFVLNIPHEFESYFEFRNNPCIVLARYKTQRKMIQFPKDITFDEFQSFLLKALNINNYDFNKDEILYYSKNSTKPLVFIPSSKVGRQFDMYKDRLSQISLIIEPRERLDEFDNKVRLRMKFIFPQSKNGVTGFFNENWSMFELVSSLRESHRDFIKYFIVPHDSNKNIVPEQTLLKDVKNPIYFIMKMINNKPIKIIFIQNEQILKEYEIKISETDTLADLKKRIDLSQLSSTIFYTVDKNIENHKNEIQDDVLMKTFYETSTPVYLEATKQNDKICFIEPESDPNTVIFNAKYLSMQISQSKNESYFKKELENVIFQKIIRNEGNDDLSDELNGEFNIDDHNDFEEGESGEYGTKTKKGKTLKLIENSKIIELNEEEEEEEEEYNESQTHKYKTINKNSEYNESSWTLTHLMIVDQINFNDNQYCELQSIDQEMRLNLKTYQRFNRIYGKNHKPDVYQRSFLRSYHRENQLNELKDDEKLDEKPIPKPHKKYKRINKEFRHLTSDISPKNFDVKPNDLKSNSHAEFFDGNIEKMDHNDQSLTVSNSSNNSADIKKEKHCEMANTTINNDDREKKSNDIVNDNHENKNRDRNKNRDEQFSTISNENPNNDIFKTMENELINVKNKKDESTLKNEENNPIMRQNQEKLIQEENLSELNSQNFTKSQTESDFVDDDRSEDVEDHKSLNRHNLNNNDQNGGYKESELYENLSQKIDFTEDSKDWNNDFESYDDYEFDEFSTKRRKKKHNVDDDEFHMVPSHRKKSKHSKISDHSNNDDDLISQATTTKKGRKMKRKISRNDDEYKIGSNLLPKKKKKKKALSPATSSPNIINYNITMNHQTDSIIKSENLQSPHFQNLNSSSSVNMNQSIDTMFNHATNQNQIITENIAHISNMNSSNNIQNITPFDQFNFQNINNNNSNKMNPNITNNILMNNTNGGIIKNIHNMNNITNSGSNAFDCNNVNIAVSESNATIIKNVAEKKPILKNVRSCSNQHSHTNISNELKPINSIQNTEQQFTNNSTSERGSHLAFPSLSFNQNEVPSFLDNNNVNDQQQHLQFNPNQSQHINLIHQSHNMQHDMHVNQHQQQQQQTAPFVKNSIGPILLPPLNRPK